MEGAEKKPSPFLNFRFGTGPVESVVLEAMAAHVGSGHTGNVGVWGDKEEKKTWADPFNRQRLI